MVAFGAQQRQHGGGVIDNLMRPFTVRKYGNEAHGRSLDPNHFLQGYSFLGPRTEIKLRQQLHDDVPLNDLDATAKEHDLAYLREKEEYDKDHNKVSHMRKIHRADDVFIQKAKNSRDDPIMGKISSKLMSTKKTLETANLLDSKVFSGFGAEEGSENADPVARLRSIVQKEYKTDTKKDKKGKQKGGLAFLAPIAIAGLSALAGKLSGDLYDFIKKKVTGSGVKVPHHKTKKEKNNFLKEFINNIE